LERAGETQQAGLAYADFTTTARPLIGASENANQELISYYLGPGHDSGEALRIAQIEIARRHDVNTLDAYAWALSGNGRYQDAQKQIARAVAVGVREARIFYHAGTIAAKLHDDGSATRYLRESVQLDPSSESAAAAREALQKLVPKSATSRGAK
jgi:Tfp pilus assembly protein PilF